MLTLIQKCNKSINPTMKNRGWKVEMKDLVKIKKLSHTQAQISTIANLSPNKGSLEGWAMKAAQSKGGHSTCLLGSCFSENRRRAAGQEKQVNIAVFLRKEYCSMRVWITSWGELLINTIAWKGTAPRWLQIVPKLLSNECCSREVSCTRMEMSASGEMKCVAYANNI